MKLSPVAKAAFPPTPSSESVKLPVSLSVRVISAACAWLLKITVVENTIVKIEK